jgi:single-strand DNA-binding protein
MIHEAQVHLAGYVATEPRFKKVAGDVSSAKLRVAYTSRRQNKETGEWSDGATTFVNIQCWRGLAENVTMSVRKGEPVLVMGRLHIRRYEDGEGNPRTAVEVEASSVGHDLTRGVAVFSRTRRAPAGIAADAAAVDGQNQSDAGELSEQAPGAGAGEAGGAPATAANGGSVVDEQAVAEFARELSESLGAGAVVGAGAEPAAGPGTDPAVSTEL